MITWKRMKNAMLRLKPHVGPPLMKVEPKTEPAAAASSEPKFTVPVTIVIVWNGKIVRGVADSVMANWQDVDAGRANVVASDFKPPPPGFRVVLLQGGETVCITEQEGLTWARGHDEETEAALAAAFALWEQAPVVGFQGATGAQGPTGVQGAVGVQGSPGVRGPVGVQGATGPTGYVPMMGAQGSTVAAPPVSAAGRPPP